MTPLRRSRHLSLFGKGEDVFVHHDLIGDIVRMDPALLAFLDYFAAERTQDEARERFRTAFTERDLDAFFEILPEHRILVPAAADEVRDLDAWHPVLGPWILVHDATPLTIGYRDRSREETVLEEPGEVARRTFALCTGERTIASIVAEVGEEARAAIFRWTHSDRQVLKLLPKPRSSYDRVPAYVESTMPYERLRSSDAPPREDVATTRSYHKDEIVSADEQFEVRETTLSHAFRVPHPALRGKTYAGRLASVLLGRGHLAPGARVVEVGGGTGFFCALFLDELQRSAPEVYERLTWTICDLAPALQRSQVERTRAHAAKVRFVQGDAVQLPLAAASVDLLFANEMIADLETVRVRRDELGEGLGAHLRERYGLALDDAPFEVWLNKGAFDLIAEVARVLRPGGRAILTEFGELDRYPVESTHLDHREFSIHFGHAQSAARACGLEAHVEVVPAMLELDGGVPVFVTNRSFFLVLRALLARAGVTLEKVAYTPEMLVALAAGRLDLERVRGLRFQPAGERVLGLRPAEFKALLLRKPPSAGPAKPPGKKKLEI